MDNLALDPVVTVSYPIIFLDFDGVIVTRRMNYREGDPKAISALNYIIKETDARIVVSSTWRFDGLVQCRANLESWGMDGSVIGVTTFLTNTAQRGDEIQDWLDNNSHGPFVILDDDNDMGDLSDFLVQTNILHGLTIFDARKAINLIRRQIQLET